MMNLREITQAEVVDLFDCEPEFLPIDDHYDAEDAQVIVKRVEKGDFGAWCVLTVKVTWNEFSGYASLGCFTFPEGQTAKANLEYAKSEYQELTAEAIEDLNKRIKQYCKRAAELKQLLS